MTIKSNLLYINSRIQIPIAEFDFDFARSGGPGGQNVNKVNSKAILHWQIVNSFSLPQAVKDRFLTKYANRITTDGELILSSQKYRDQKRNIQDCLEKLDAMITNVATPPIIRKATKPTIASKERRTESKYAHSKKKQLRHKPQIED